MNSACAVHASKAFNSAAKVGGWASLCDPTLSFHYPEFDPLVEIWRQAAAKGRLPMRREIDLKKLKHVLRAMALYERVVNGTIRYRVRLMGTAFAEAMGDLSGRFIDEAVAPEQVARWKAALDVAFAAGRPVRFVGQLISRDYLVAEYFEAPLLSDDGMPNLVLAAGHFMPRRWAEVAQEEERRASCNSIDSMERF